MTEEASIVEEGVSPAAQSPLVAVTFQRNDQRKEKYLEAEPKALGITQMGLSVFKMICATVFLTKEINRLPSDIPFFISSLLIVIAGSLAVAAQNLHLPTLRACLAMQIVAAVASIVNVVYTLIKMEHTPYYCWHYYYDNATLNYGEICHQVENIQSHFHAGGVLIQATLFAISVTLAVYCCKVVNCCAPAPKVPVITVQTPSAPQRTDTTDDSCVATNTC